MIIYKIQDDLTACDYIVSYEELTQEQLNEVAKDYQFLSGPDFTKKWNILPAYFGTPQIGICGGVQVIRVTD